MEHLGLYLGYPACCILAFCFGNGAMSYRGQVFKLRGTGFVPCQHCNATKTEQELVDEINANRKCPEPFTAEILPHLTTIYTGEFLFKKVAEFFNVEKD